jgi:hypothetical protein
LDDRRTDTWLTSAPMKKDVVRSTVTPTVE